MTLVIETEQLTVGWSADAILLEQASFTVERGEIFGILGRSASGKSTLLRVLVGLEPPIAGEVRVLGRRPVLGDERPRYGVMFQHGALFGSLTVGQNIALPLQRWTALPPDAVDALVHAKLRLVGLAGAEHQLPAQLSGGMRKRAAIARALALEPPLLFLDEPSSGLDPITSAEIDHLISTLARALELTVVVVTHELGSINSIVDRCILLDRDSRSIVALGRPRDLAASTHSHVRNFFARVPEVT